MRENKTKKSQLVWEPKIVRKLLKMNAEVTYCPYCGKSLTDGCDCKKNIVVDVKPFRDNDTGVVDHNRTVFVFQNNTSFQADYAQLLDELKAKQENETEQCEESHE